MLTHRLLVPGVFVLGLLLLVVGLAAIVMGVPIVRMEIGWTEVVGGAVAASAGCVILAMGVLAGQLDAIRQSLTYLALEDTFGSEQPAPAAMDPVDAHAADLDDYPEAEPVAVPEPEPRRLSHPLAPQRWTPPAATVRPEPPLPVATHDEAAPVDLPPVEQVEHAPPLLDEGAPALLHAEEEASHSPAVLPPDRVADPVADLPAPAPSPLPAPPASLPPLKAKPNFLSSFLARRGIDTAGPATPGERALFDTDHLAGTAPEPARTPIDLSSGWDDEPLEEHAAGSDPTAATQPEAAGTEPVEQVVHDPPPPEPEPDPLQPVVVGRYNAGSASYVMYSNGMIEVETEQGTHQFGSMQELKSFIEKRDARVS